MSSVSVRFIGLSIVASVACVLGTPYVVGYQISEQTTEYLVTAIISNFITVTALYIVFGSQFQSSSAFRGFALGILCNYCLLVLFGAPFFSLIAETLLLSALVASLGAVPVSCTLGIHYSKDVMRMFKSSTLTSSAQPRGTSFMPSLYPAVGCLIGCWLGAIPLPLDWDVWWQVYPIPLVYGTLIGYIAGRTYQAFFLLQRNKRAGPYGDLKTN